MAMNHRIERFRWRYWLGWGLIGAGYLVSKFPIIIGWRVGKDFAKDLAGPLGASLAILGAMVIGSFVLDGGYFERFRMLAAEPQASLRLSMMLATVLGPVLIAIGLVVIALDITSPDFIETIFAWHYALPLVGGVALILFVPVMEIFWIVSAKETERPVSAHGRGQADSWPWG
jgi:hypothetical protein